MTTQPNPAQFRPQGLGAPPAAPSGPSRLLPGIRMAMTGGLIVTLGLYGAQILLPQSIKPSTIIGWMAGDTMRAEIEASREAKIDLDRRDTDAIEQARAKAHADVIAMQQALEARTRALDGYSTAANVADWGCILGRVVAGATQSNVPANFRRRTESDDWNDFGRGVAQAACGLGDGLRQEVTRSQLDAIRETAAARGAPMADGSVRVASDFETRAIRVVDAITAPSAHYDYAYVESIQKWVQQFPQSLQAHIKANLPSNSTGWDLFVDRARAVDKLITPG